MSRYFAQLDNQSIVQRVIVADSLEWCVNHLGGQWVETFIDKEDHNYAGIGYTFHTDKKNFSRPQIFKSWTLDEKCNWNPPVPVPSHTEDELYTWEEKEKEWIKYAKR